MNRTLEFTVTGDSQIHCGSCEHRITRSLQQLKGVENVDASAETQSIRVTIDSKLTSPEEVQKKLQSIGYETERRG